jgi:hypothetical protein
MTLSEEETSCGVSKSSPRAVIIGPLCFGGMGINDLYTDSSCINIECILNNFKTESEMSQVMEIVLNWLQINAGTITPILESTFAL